MMSYDDISSIMSNIMPFVPNLIDWNIDIDTLNTTIILRYSEERYISHTILYDDLSSAANPLEFVTSIVEKLRDWLSRREEHERYDKSGSD